MSCAAVDTSTAIETPQYESCLDDLSAHILGVTVKILVMADIPGGTLVSHGTGVIIGRSDNKYLIQTNKHVVTIKNNVEPGKLVYYNVEHPTAGNMRATVLATRADIDAALLVIECNKSLPVAEFAKETPPLLTPVYHYGFGGVWFKGPFFTTGIFSSKTRVWTSLPGAWTAQCPVWYGCSGGGIFLRDGTLLGIVAMTDTSIRGGWLSGFVPHTELVKWFKALGLK